MRTLPEPSVPAAGAGAPVPSASAGDAAADQVLLAALGGRVVQVQEVLPDGGAAPPSRPVLTPTHLLLPAAWRLLDAEAQAALRRAAIAHAAAHLLHSPSAQAADHLKPIGVAVAGTLEDARVEALLARRLPGVVRWFRAAAGPAPDPHALDLRSLLGGLACALRDPGYRHPGHWVDKGRALFLEAWQQHGLDHYEAFRRVASVLANDLGQMRVRHLPREDVVATAYRDDNSHLWRHAAGSEEPLELVVPLDPVPVPAGRVPSAARTPAGALPTPSRPAVPAARPTGEARPPASEPDTTSTRHTYPEWDCRLARERDPWCTVLESRTPSEPLPGAPLASSGTALRLPARTFGGRRLPRQWEGDALDLDAVVDAALQRRLGLPPDGRVFTAPGRRRRPCSVLVLLDLSASGNDPVQGRPLVDLQKEGALRLAQALQAVGDRVAVHGFCSNTRAEVRYQRLLDFGEPLDAASVARIAAARAAWSTRLGTALRHATGLAAAERGGGRGIVVVTDGVPHDVDVFHPAYLREDARVAVTAARRRGVAVECLAVQGQAPVPVAELAAMFGARHCAVLREPEQLARRLTEIATRIAQDS